MKYLPHQLTDSVRRMLPPEEKKRLGVAALCMEELIECQTIKTEKDFQKQVAAYLRQRGILFKQSRMDKRTTVQVGTLDFNCIVPIDNPALQRLTGKKKIGLWVAFECKKFGQVPTPEQLEEIQKINDAGGIAWVVFSLTELKAILDAVQA